MAKRRAREDESTWPALEVAARLAAPAEVPPGLLLLGPDAFLLASARDAVVARALGPRPGPTLSELEGDAASLAAVLDELRTLPFLGDRRVVVVRDAGGFVAEHAAALADYLAAPAPTSALVLEAAKVDRRFKAVQGLLARLQVVACEAPGPDGLVAFVHARAKARGRAFAPDAALALVERLGGHDVTLAALDAEVEKLSAAVREGPVTAATVGALSTLGSSEDSFALVGRIGRGDVAGALACLGRILADGLVAHGERTRDARGIAPILLGSLRWDLARLLRGRALLERGGRPREIARELKVWGDTDLFEARIARATREDLGARHELLRDADRALKTSGDADATLIDVVVRLARAEARATEAQRARA